MKLLLYKIKLAAHLVFFIIRLLANTSNKVKPAVLSLFILGLILTISGISFLTGVSKPTETVAVSTFVPSNSYLYEVNNYSKEQLQAEINFWETILQHQPKSRDVLLNLSLLYSAQQLDEKAAEYRQKALYIDPNNPLFE